MRKQEKILYDTLKLKNEKRRYEMRLDTTLKRIKN